jgi:hypothetical protein
VTEEEILAIEKLREQMAINDRDYFVYGVLPSTEAFRDENGEIRGFSALFCEWLTRLFGIPFKPEFIERDNFLLKLANFDVDFTGTMTAGEEQRKIFFMTTAIATHMIRYFRLVDSLPLEYIAKTRPLRYAFFTDNTAAINLVSTALEDNTYEYGRGSL